MSPCKTFGQSAFNVRFQVKSVLDCQNYTLMYSKSFDETQVNRTATIEIVAEQHCVTTSPI